MRIGKCETVQIRAPRLALGTATRSLLPTVLVVLSAMAAPGGAAAQTQCSWTPAAAGTFKIWTTPSASCFVGVGTTGPTALLHLVQSGAQSTTFTGLGTPAARIWGGTYVDGGITSLDFSNSTTQSSIARIGLLNRGFGSSLVFGTSNSYGSGVTNSAMVINEVGNVSIGSMSAGALLPVGTYDRILEVSSTVSPFRGAVLLVGTGSVDGNIISDVSFSNTLAGGPDARVGTIRFTRQGAADKGQFEVWTRNGTVWGPGSTNQASLVVSPAGNVGIGTPRDTAPLAPLHVVGANANPEMILDNYGGSAPVQPLLAFRLARGTATAATAVQAGDYIGSLAGRAHDGTAFSGGQGRVSFVAAENWDATHHGAHLTFETTSKVSTVQIERMRIDSNGSVLIGTTTPDADPLTKLYVNGTVKGTNIQAQYQDVAEWVPARQRLSPGMVVIVDTESSNGVLAASAAYDTRVAGVISARPGLVLGEAGDNKELVATTGRVKVFVDATKNPIRAGDLLVTSDREGFAMRSEPLIVQGVAMHRPGTLIGKALQPLASGTGEILILLSLQ